MFPVNSVLWPCALAIHQFSCCKIFMIYSKVHKTFSWGLWQQIIFSKKSWRMYLWVTVCRISNISTRQLVICEQSNYFSSSNLLLNSNCMKCISRKMDFDRKKQFCFWIFFKNHSKYAPWGEEKCRSCLMIWKKHFHQWQLKWNESLSRKLEQIM